MTFGQELVVLHTRPSMFEGFQCMLHITSETFHIGSLKVKLIMACHDVPQITTIVIATMSLHSKIQQTSNMVMKVKAHLNRLSTSSKVSKQLSKL